MTLVHTGGLKFRPDIEGLRGIAVLLVVLYHAGVPWLSGGFVGVDVFFVLSGYLITRLLVDELSSTGTVSLRTFYARRIRRLLPAAALVIVVTLLASLLVLSPLKQVEVARSATAAAAYVANISFALESADYFGSDVSQNPLLHMWSLSVEEQFYLLWPVLLLLAWRVGRRRGLTIALTVTALGGLVLSVWSVGVAPEWAFYGTHSRAWQFAVGGLAGLITLRGGPVLVGLGWAGLAAVLVSGGMLTSAFPFPGWFAVPVTVGAALVILGSGAAPSSLLGSVLSARPLRWLGQISYSWYLWHWPALVLTEAARGPLTLPVRLSVAAGALVLSAVTYRFVENPVRHHRRLIAEPRSALLLGLLLTAASVSVATGARGLASNTLDSPRYQAITHAASDFRDAPACHAGLLDAVVRECVFGSARSGATVVLMGDSHALQWLPAMEALADARGWRLVTMFKSSCPMADIRVYNRNLRREEPECSEWRAAALARAIELRPDLLVMSSGTGILDRPYLIDGLTRLSYEMWRDGYRRTLERLDVAGVRTVLVRDTPWPGFEVPDCLAGARSADACSFPRVEGVDDAAFAALRAASGGLPSVSLVDLTSEFCGAGTCPAVIDGVIVYRDWNHISASFSRALTPQLGKRLAPLMAGR